MLVLEEAKATRLCLIAAHCVSCLSFKEELTCSVKFHDIYCTNKECEHVDGISCLVFAAG